MEDNDVVEDLDSSDFNLHKQKGSSSTEDSEVLLNIKYHVIIEVHLKNSSNWCEH